MGSGGHVHGDQPGFYEPGGLAVSGDTLYVADTNHHRALAVDLRTKRWRVLLGQAAPIAAGESEDR
ncbi:MAG: hypothetical protein O7F11_05770 [Acidobacteria bacterium]|nr:hypothetical protein [Acidobacteriota bacterium]